MATVRQELPHNQDAEERVIAALMTDPDTVLALGDLALTGDQFYDRRLGWAFDVIQAMFYKGQPTTSLSLVQDALGRERPEEAGGGSVLDAVGGAAGLTRLLETFTTAYEAPHYARIIKREAAKRKMMELGSKLVRQAYEFQGDDPGELQNWALGEITKEEIQDDDKQSHLYGDDPRHDYMATQQRRAEMLAADPDSVIRLGFPLLDRMFCYLQPATLTVIGGGPSVGKTMFMEHVAEYNAQRGHFVVFYLMELSIQYMIDRRLTRYSLIPQIRIVDGYIGPEIMTGQNLIHKFKANEILVAAGGWSAERVVADMTRLRARGLCDMAIIDYLQLVPLPERGPYGSNAAAALGSVAGQFKTAASRLDIPVVLGSRVVRTKGRDDDRPTLQDLRNSGEIEERANQVVLLYRPKDQNENGITELIEADVAKNTGGARQGRVMLTHLLGQLTLAEAPSKHQEDQWEQEEESIDF